MFGKRKFRNLVSGKERQEMAEQVRKMKRIVKEIENYDIEEYEKDSVLKEIKEQLFYFEAKLNQKVLNV